MHETKCLESSPIVGYNYFKKICAFIILIVSLARCFLNTSKALVRILVGHYAIFVPQERSGVIRRNVSQGHF